MVEGQQSSLSPIQQGINGGLRPFTVIIFGMAAIRSKMKTPTTLLASLPPAMSSSELFFV